MKWTTTKEVKTEDDTIHFWPRASTVFAVAAVTIGMGAIFVLLGMGHEKAIGLAITAMTGMACPLACFGVGGALSKQVRVQVKKELRKEMAEEQHESA